MAGIAFLLARAGSKGLPGKNTYPLLGKPLLEWTLDYLIASPLIDKVVVSTDDPYIIENYKTSYSSKVYVQHRPPSLSGDYTTTESVLSYICHELGDSFLSQYDYGVYMQITEPFRPPDILENCVTKYLSSNCDSVFAAVESHKNFWVPTDSLLIRVQDGNIPEAPRQHKTHLLREDTGICLVSDLSLFCSGRRIGDRPGYVLYNHFSQYIDIHTHSDLLFAEQLLSISKD